MKKMKLPIKKKYFDMVKDGTKKFESRDAHITFVCEGTGEHLRKEVIGARLVKNRGEHPDVCQDENLVEFKLK